MKEISHGSIIPLSGGMSVGAKQAFGKDPDWALSWGAFGKNESHFKKNFSDVPFMTLESEEIDQVDLSSLSKVDVIHSVPPCSALSSLNSSWNNPKMKGSNAESTKWMHYSTEIALGKLKPKVFIFENAPGLLQKAGEEMRSYLIEKAKRHNYSISFLSQK
jgi:site-specific DNA-cytosine methylase